MKTLKNSVLYLASSVIQQAIPLFFVPIFTRMISPENYGNLSLFNLFFLIFCTLGGVSLNSHLHYIYFREREKVAYYVTNYIAIAGVFCLAMGILNLGIVHYSNYTKIPLFYSWIVPVAAFFSFVFSIYLTLLRNASRAWAFSLWNISLAIINFSLTLWLLYFTELDWESRALTAIGTQILFGTAASVLMWQEKSISKSVDKTIWKRILMYSLPFLGIVFVKLALDYSDQYLIEHYLGKATLGIYRTGYTVGMLVLVAMTAISHVFSPKIYQKFAENERSSTPEKRSEIVAYYYGFFTVAILFCIGVILLHPLLYYWEIIDAGYAESQKYVIPIAVAYFIYMIQTAAGIVIAQTDFTHYNFYIFSIGVGINLALNLYLIPLHGALAAAYSTVVSFLVMSILSFAVAQKLLPLPWGSKQAFNDFKTIVQSIFTKRIV